MLRQLHLRVDERGELLLVVLQHVQRVLFGKVAAQMLHQLAGEVIKQVGVVVVANVVEVNQRPDEVIFGPGFLHLAAEVLQKLLLGGAQMLNQQLAAHRLQMD